MPFYCCQIFAFFSASFPCRCCAYLPAIFKLAIEGGKNKRVGGARVHREKKKEHTDTFYPRGVSCGIHDIVRREREWPCSMELFAYTQYSLVVRTTRARTNSVYQSVVV